MKGGLVSLEAFGVGWWNTQTKEDSVGSLPAGAEWVLGKTDEQSKCVRHRLGRCDHDGSQEAWEKLSSRACRRLGLLGPKQHWQPAVQRQGSVEQGPSVVCPFKVMVALGGPGYPWCAGVLSTFASASRDLFRVSDSLFF